MRELLELTHALDVGLVFGKFVIDQMCDTLKNARPDLPTRAFDLVADEVNAAIAAEMTAVGGFEDVIVALYRSTSRARSGNAIRVCALRPGRDAGHGFHRARGDEVPDESIVTLQRT